jgi:hypothetical protein
MGTTGKGLPGSALRLRVDSAIAILALYHAPWPRMYCREWRLFQQLGEGRTAFLKGKSEAIKAGSREVFHRQQLMALAR